MKRRQQMYRILLLVLCYWFFVKYEPIHTAQLPEPEPESRLRVRISPKACGAWVCFPILLFYFIQHSEPPPMCHTIPISEMLARDDCISSFRIYVLGSITLWLFGECSGAVECAHSLRPAQKLTANAYNTTCQCFFFQNKIKCFF